MLRMPAFDVLRPTSVDEAVALRRQHPASRYVAGGTDLLPNLKHGLDAPTHLVSLSHVEGLAQITATDEAIRIGARTTIHTLATDPIVQTELPGLAQAASTIAGPQHRRMGTLGGNVLLDTRCLFYNQTEAWRTAVGFCLKKDGQWCHVIGSPKACVAAQSSDSVPMLIALGATVHFATPDGPAEIELSSLFTTDGRRESHRTVPAEALLTEVVVPRPRPGHRSVYRKVRARNAVDYPQLSVAFAGTFDGTTCQSLRVVLGAMLPQPKVLKGSETLVGTEITDEAATAFAERAFKQARPQPQIHGDPEWRRHLARVETYRGLLELRPAS
ncbi:MAG: FAD binding domain-containing protein [Myxococcota bacterium]